MYRLASVSSYSNRSGNFEGQGSLDQNKGWLFTADLLESSESAKFSLPFRHDLLYEIQYCKGEKCEYKWVYFIPAISTHIKQDKYYVVLAEGEDEGKLVTCRQVTLSRKLYANSHDGSSNQVFFITQIGDSFQATVDSKVSAPVPLLLTKWKIKSTRALVAQPLESGATPSTQNLRPVTEFEGFPDRSPEILTEIWYCPFIFVTEETRTPAEQLQKTPVYRLTVKKFWVLAEYQIHNDKSSCLRLEREVQNESSNVVTQEKSTGRCLSGNFGLSASLGKIGVILKSHLEKAFRYEKRNAHVDIVRSRFDGPPPQQQAQYVLSGRSTIRSLDGIVVATIEYSYPTSKYTKVA